MVPNHQPVMNSPLTSLDPPSSDRLCVHSLDFSQALSAALCEMASTYRGFNSRGLRVFQVMMVLILGKNDI